MSYQEAQKNEKCKREYKKKKSKSPSRKKYNLRGEGLSKEHTDEEMRADFGDGISFGPVGFKGDDNPNTPDMVYGVKIDGNFIIPNEIYTDSRMNENEYCRVVVGIKGEERNVGYFTLGGRGYYSLFKMYSNGRYWKVEYVRETDQEINDFQLYN